VFNLETFLCFKIMRFVILVVLQLFYCFSYVIKYNLNLVHRNVFQILKLCHTTEINDNRKTQYIACCIRFIVY
jgi:hypothetical protein